jgi:pSer/pThr/pTyr-binding forkhead associated (FHA) protein
VLDVANVSLNVIILLLRVAVVFLLYFFLWQVLRVVTRDLRSSSIAAPDQSSPYGQLVIVSAGQSGQAVGKTFPLAPITVIGRSMENEVALNDSFLSSKHARLELRGDEWVLEDMGSTNGTFVNGFEARDPTIVNEGDIVRIGRIELKLTR